MASRKLTPRPEVGVVGLGKMGKGIAQQLATKGWRVIGYNRTTEVTRSIEGEGIVGAYSLAELTEKLARPRIIWLMLPAGPVIDEHLFGENGLAGLLTAGDVVIDGGNSFYKDASRRAETLKAQDIHFIDVGTSGGPGGARNGACLMIGGEKEIFTPLESLFRDLSKDGTAYKFFPGHGAGHFVKMIHNGIEYGMMQALAEGFTILKQSNYNLNLVDVSDIYNNGSVIESRLTQWLKQAFEQHTENLNEVSGSVRHTGEGEWTVKTAEEMGLVADIINGSFQFRVASTDQPSYTGQILSALRQQFGGHAIK